MSETVVAYRTIGGIRSEHIIADQTLIQPPYAKGCKGRVEIDREFADGLSELEGFSHVFLVCHFHQACPARLRVKPFLLDVERGVLATRATCRPNPFKLSVVELVRREGNVLHVDGVEILDGAPLLDIKPYVSRFEYIGTTRDGRQDSVDEKTARRRGKRGFRGGDGS